MIDAGPVLARVRQAYSFEDGNKIRLTVTVIAGDTGARWELDVKEDRPEMILEFDLLPVPGVKEALFPKGYDQWARNRKLRISPSPEPFCFLSPDTSIANIWIECPPTIRLTRPGGPELVIRSLDPGAWADPVAPFTYGGYSSWNLEMIPKMWEVWQRKRIAVGYAVDGTVTLRAPLTKGTRKWSVGAGMPPVRTRLDRVKNLVLNWPEARDPRHPRLFVSRQEVIDDLARAKTDAALARQLRGLPLGICPAYAEVPAQADKRVQQRQMRIVARLRNRLALLGNFDVMRYAIQAAALYDALIHSGLVSSQERALLRAQMAYLGYVLAHPRTWSMERGYISGNPNMSCSYTLSLGIIACLLKEHPQARAWADYATRWMDKWLSEEVGPNGTWMPEGSHYGYVSLAPMLSYAIAARRAGYHDFIGDPRLKKLILYFAKYQTPRDPQRGNRRVIPSYGCGTSGDSLGVFGVVARMYADTDPSFSRIMQWLWIENGMPINLGDARLGGFEGYYMDRGLPAEPPAWGSELFPALGALLLAGFATPHESYLNFIACAQSLRNLDIWTPGIGAIAQWFGRGKPISSCFIFQTGCKEHHELLRDGVLLARNWGAPDDPKGPFGYYTRTHFSTFAPLPHADYVRSRFVITRPDDRDWFPQRLPAYPRLTPAREPKLDWTRQLLFLKDVRPTGPAYLVLRDSTKGGQPTAWHFWSLTEMIGTPEQFRDRAAFLTDKPGHKILPARRLPLGSRYTAAGQYGMDIEYFIVNPAHTPRHTLRYGGVYRRVPQYQDLLHLQRPGDGAYYLVIYPRPPSEAVPAFSALDNDKIIKIFGRFGTDYALLAEEDAKATAEGVSFRGTAAAVQARTKSTILSLGAAGEIRYREYGLAAPAAAALIVTKDTLRLALPAGNPGGRFTITAPGHWRMKKHPPGSQLKSIANRHVITCPEGPGQIVLISHR